MRVSRLAVKVFITWIMIEKLYTRSDALCLFGLVICSLLGGKRPLAPSTDFVLFIATTMVSKNLELRDYKKNLLFDAHILFLAGIYHLRGDKLRVALLAAWLPFHYWDDPFRFRVYTLLVVFVLLARLFYDVYRFFVLSGLYRGLYEAGGTSRGYGYSNGWASRKNGGAC